MPSPFVWFHHNGANAKETRKFFESLLDWKSSEGHPALEEGESAALALATVVGLSISELAQAFVVAPRSIEQRLTRARQRLRDKGDVEGTTPERGRELLGAVLRTIHLLFNEGYWSASDEAPIRADLCRLALGLVRSLFETFPREPETAELLSLLMLHDARREARLDQNGCPVPLPEQDRTRWDHDTIHKGQQILDNALELGVPGPLQIEAAIATVHCKARTAGETDWVEIAALYAILETHRLTPAVRVNRAFALGKAKGPLEGLTLLEQSDIDAASYPYVHLVRASLLEEAEQREAAILEFELAARCARNAHGWRQIHERLLSPSDTR